MKPQKSLFVNLYYTCISLTLRSPPDGASSNHEDRLATPITNSASAPADPESSADRQTDRQTDIQSQSQSEGGSGRSSPCIMYSVESGEDGQTSGEEQTSPHHLTDHTQSQDHTRSLDITPLEDNSDKRNKQYVLLKTRIFVMVMNLFLCFSDMNYCMRK